MSRRHFGTSGDIGYLEQLLQSLDYAVTVVAEAQTTNEGWTVEYFIYRLRPTCRPGA